MKKIGLGFLTVLIMIAGVNLAHAQDAVSPEKTALIKELFEATGGRQNFKDIMSNMLSATQEQINNMVRDLKTGAPADNARYAKMANESMERITARSQDFFEKKFDFDQLVADITPVYDKHFTTDELRDMITFYRSPSGQKATKEMPLMMSEMMAAMSKNFLPSFMEFIKQTTNEEVTALMKKLPKKKSTRGS